MIKLEQLHPFQPSQKETDYFCPLYLELSNEPVLIKRLGNLTLDDLGETVDHLYESNPLAEFVILRFEEDSNG